MTDGSSRSLEGVTGSEIDSGYGFDFIPDPLPKDVTSPEQVKFEFLDGAPDPPFPSVAFDIRVVNFEILEGVASYNIEILVEGVIVTTSGMIGAGAPSPLFIDQK